MFCLAVVSCSGETLKELLVFNYVPLAPFNQSELAEAVQGVGNSNDQQVVLAYRKLSGEVLVGAPQLIRYNEAIGTVLRAEEQVDETSVCSGSIGDIRFIGEFTLLSTEVSPSAECLLILDKDFKVQKTLYGFSPVEVAPNLVVIIENMIHFAPVHQERLQLADLGNGATSELYPMKGDALRAQLISEHMKHIPTRETCARMNDPCNPEKFDEDVRSLGTDGKGRFAFLVLQSASHATTSEKSPVPVTSQAVLYVYKQNSTGWRYCEEKIADSHQVEALDKSLHSDFDQVVTRCTPTLLVVADISAAD